MDAKLHSLNMLEVINPNATGANYCRRYINGRRVGQMRWNLANVHAQVKECFSTTGKGGNWYHRHVIRCPIDFSK